MKDLWLTHSLIDALDDITDMIREKCSPAELAFDPPGRFTMSCNCGGGCKGSCSGRCGGCGGDCKSTFKIGIGGL